jgi:hypothetical protein
VPPFFPASLTVISFFSSAIGTIPPYRALTSWHCFLLAQETGELDGLRWCRRFIVV